MHVATEVNHNAVAQPAILVASSTFGICCIHSWNLEPLQHVCCHCSFLSVLFCVHLTMQLLSAEVCQPGATDDSRL